MINILASGRRCFPVVSDGQVKGMITIRDVQAVPREQWNRKLVGEAMTPAQ